jgi:hypothetical protein
VDLVSAVVVKRIAATGDVAEVALGDGYAYALPRASSDRIRILALDLTTGTETFVTSAQTGAGRIQISAVVGALYLAAGSGYGSSVERYDLSAGTPVLTTGASYGPTSCGDLWMSQSGTRFFTRCGTAHRASSSWLEDLAFAGTIAPAPVGYGSSTFVVRQLAESSAAGEVSAIASDDAAGYSSQLDDRTLRSYRADGLAAREVAVFPSEAVNGSSYPWSGRFVFYRADGSERYVILQLAAAAGVLQDFGVATF